MRLQVVLVFRAGSYLDFGGINACEGLTSEWIAECHNGSYFACVESLSTQCIVNNHRTLPTGTISMTPADMGR